MFMRSLNIYIVKKIFRGVGSLSSPGLKNQGVVIDADILYKNEVLKSASE